MDLSFLKSNRFWALTLGSVIFYLKTKGWLGDPEVILIETILGGFITIRTVDRATEKLGCSEQPTPPQECCTGEKVVE